MDSNEDKKIIIEQYRIYSDAKEKFIDRQFTTNKFYLVLNIVILVVTYLVITILPTVNVGALQPVFVFCLIGIALAFMWWMNVDSYQMLIKVKYARVLEYLETKLPEQPYHKEFTDYTEMKKKNNLIVFGDFQKTLAITFAGIYFVILAYNITDFIRHQYLTPIG